MRITQRKYELGTNMAKSARLRSQTRGGVRVSHFLYVYKHS
jgi:hypothetical protein